MPCSEANLQPSLPCARLDRGSHERRLPWKRVCGRAVVLYMQGQAPHIRAPGGSRRRRADAYIWLAA